MLNLPHLFEAIAEIAAAAGLRLVRPLPEFPHTYAPDDTTTEPHSTRVALVIDTETTGLERDAEIVEIGAQLFRYHVGTLRVLVAGPLWRFREQPKRPIPPEATKVHGITDADVAGLAFAEDLVRSLFAEADLVICHNAAYDAPLLAARFPWIGTERRPRFVCSLTDVDWSARGYESPKLRYLLHDHAGAFMNAHDATADVGALTHILATPFADGSSPLAELLSRGLAGRVRVVADGAPFHAKDRLKARGYRWNDPSDPTARFRFKAWWTEVPAEQEAEEREWLTKKVGVLGRFDPVNAATRFLELAPTAGPASAPAPAATPPSLF